MKIKSMFILLVTNIFVMMAVTILYEYISIQDKLTQLNNTIEVTLERSIHNATASEELFTLNYANAGNVSVYSYGVYQGGAGDTVNSIAVWDGTKFVAINAYGLTMQNVGFPVSTTGNKTAWNMDSGASVTDLSTSVITTCNGYTSTDVFEYLYGNVTNDYNNPNLAWANLGSPETKQDAKNAHTVLTQSTKIANGSQIPSNPIYTAEGVRQDFAKYYEEIGSHILTANFVKIEDTANNRYTLDYMVYPTLADMGLPMEDKDGNVYSLGSLNNGMNVMTDNWCQVAKIGKRITNTSVGQIATRSYYYLTPYSLGVTYIPKDVLKETFIANLDTTCRLNKLDSTTVVWGKGQINPDATTKDIINSATGCISGNGESTSVYINGGNTAEKHIVGANENIINDGVIEYDLNSIEIKIEYFKVDFWNKNNAIVVQRCVGEIDKAYDNISGLKMALENNVTDYKLNDTGYKYLTSPDKQSYYIGKQKVDLGIGYQANQGNRIVAKVSVRLKVHIPYDNALIQWTVNKYTGHSNSEHYDIKLYNSYNSAQNFREGVLTTNDSGVYYQTSTYFTIAN